MEKKHEYNKKIGKKPASDRIILVEISTVEHEPISNP